MLKWGIENGSKPQRISVYTATVWKSPLTIYKSILMWLSVSYISVNDDWLLCWRMKLGSPKINRDKLHLCCCYFRVDGLSGKIRSVGKRDTRANMQKIWIQRNKEKTVSICLSQKLRQWFHSTETNKKIYNNTKFKLNKKYEYFQFCLQWTVPLLDLCASRFLKKYASREWLQ